MNKKQAMKKWEVTSYQVDKICKYLGISSKHIPEEITPVYIPDKRYKADPHRFYIFVLDVIINTHLELVNITQSIVETCVVQLKNAGLIVLKHGKTEESVDYHDYIISPNREIFYNWKYSKMKAKIALIAPLVSASSEGITCR